MDRQAWFSSIIWKLKLELFINPSDVISGNHKSSIKNGRISNLFSIEIYELFVFWNDSIAHKNLE